GYNVMGPGFGSVDESSSIYRQRKDRILFLNETFKLDGELEYLIAGHYAIELDSVTFVANSSLALLKYSIGFCIYMAFVDLARIDEKEYVPLSIWKAIS